ncbi:MAG: DUF2384 domain-containing protein [Chitinophagaceae bacterium]|nr:MAG: DUF2384 domain-containing protein [Chitinophagaceae bacterium]
METAAADKVLRKYEKKYASSISLFLSSKEGLEPQAAFDLLALTLLPGSRVESVFYVTLKTLNNYKRRNAYLNPSMSEKVLSIFALYKKGLTIFGSVREFNAWMAGPAYGLGGQKPDDLLDTMTGVSLIDEELTRLEYGDLA